MTAASWAAAVEPGTPVRWRALEVAAFEPYPAVQEQLDPAGKYGRVRRSGGMRTSFALAVPLMILIVVVFLAPVAGFATLMGDRFGITHPDPRVTIPAAGIIFTIALPLLLVSFVLWLRAGRPRDVIRQYQSGIALVLGVLSALLMQNRGVSVGVPDWQLWIIPVVADAVLGGVFFAMLWAAGRRTGSRAEASTQGPAAASSPPAAGEPLRRVAEQIDRLTPSQRAAVGADVAAAVRDLARRGVITAADGDWALGADLGKLALRMSQSRKRI